VYTAFFSNLKNIWQKSVNQKHSTTSGKLHKTDGSRSQHIACKSARKSVSKLPTEPHSIQHLCNIKMGENDIYRSHALM